MGVVIRGLILKQFLGKECEENIWDTYPDAEKIWTIDFSPIKHLSVVEPGYYDVDYLDGYLGMGYGRYNHFRQEICKMVHSFEPKEIWDNIEKYKDFEFVEFINFADNEGCFDYIVAEKLYKDFIKYIDKAESVLDSMLFDYYKDYMSILKNVYDFKGVVMYS